MDNRKCQGSTEKAKYKTTKTKRAGRRHEPPGLKMSPTQVFCQILLPIRLCSQYCIYSTVGVGSGLGTPTV